MRFTGSDYGELLGLYLGDGCISRVRRVYSLRLSLDARHPRIVGEATELLRRCFAGAHVGRVVADEGSTVVLCTYSLHLPCVFPQHGPGKKHERKIELEDWQWRLVEADPYAFLRGCIRSDGCTFVNRTGAYSYLSYDFANKSEDIVQLFTSACDLVGVTYRVNSTRDRVRINCRASVAKLEERVGVKN